MHVQHENPATSTVGHDGHQWEALREGIFNVPDEVAAALLARPGWTRYMGEAPYQVSGAATPPTTATPAPEAVPETGAQAEADPAGSSESKARAKKA